VDLGGASNGATNDGGGSGGGGNGAADAGGSDAGAGGDGGTENFPQQTSNKLDLLFVVDNSISMQDKQQILQQSFVDLVGRLTNPLCIDSNGRATASQPAAPDAACPSGGAREFAPVTDMHIGIVSSSLGGHGADFCSAAGDPNWNPTKDDHGRLIGAPGMRFGAPPTFQNVGFFAWDPTNKYGGEADSGNLINNFQTLVKLAGEEGCGFEAPLEALYRFLIDPNPPLDVVNENNVSVPHGTDNEVLAQRNAFLRPDSAVLAVVLSDENDCSIMDSGVGWLAAQGTLNDAPFHLPRATSICATNPNDPCCVSCAAQDAPVECSIASDPECNKGSPYDELGDALNLRCWEQKRRFGIDFLYPIQRYVDGLTKTTIHDRDGQPVTNPLFEGGARNPSLVSVGVIVGLPWQDIARDPSASRLELLSAPELRALDRWNVVLGNPEQYVRAEDPFMVESWETRAGANPITGVSMAPPTSVDPTAAPNGHEFFVPNRNELQYACIFPLADPKDCSTGVGACDCLPPDLPQNKPVCNPPGGGAAGTTQYFAKAYPGLRELDVAKRMGDRSFVASVCPKSIDPADADFGYRPAFDAMMARLRRMLE
jgi:hypothetical protein